MSNPDEWVSRLQRIVGEAHVVHDSEKLGAAAVDGKVPKAIVSPATIDQVSEIVAYAHEQGLAIIPRGNGTKMGLGSIPKRVDLVLSTGRLNRIIDRDCDNLTLSVESGVRLSEVQRDLENRGYVLPLDPPFTQRATLGGIVASNSSGPKRLRYGTARDLITGIKAVFPNGDIVVSGGKTAKNVSGYDMVKLLIGSLGTLGVICEITLTLLPLPEKERTLLIPFSGLGEANRLVHEMVKSQLIPASLDLLNSTAANRINGLMAFPEAKYLVAIGLEGVAEAVDRQISEIRGMGKNHGARDVLSLDSEDHHDFWITIRDFAEVLVKDSPDLICLKSSGLISKSGEMVGSYERIAQEFGFDCACVCHAGSGILCAHVLVGTDFWSKMDSLIGLIRQFTAGACRSGGNLTVQSCPLPIKKAVNVWGELGSDYPIMRRLKQAIDPAGTLNPGRYVGGL
jgi:glycolate oxidase FAD binding subunit